MAKTLRAKIHFVIGLVGFFVFCSGILILTSAWTLQNGHNSKLVYGFGSITCQYWAGIPTILTGAVLILTVKKRSQFLKYVSMCCTLITMVVAIGVILEEAVHSAYVRSFLHSCRNPDEDWKDCTHLEETIPYYYILLYATDVVLVLCTFVLLVLFAEWILFVAPKSQQTEQVEQPQPPPPYEGSHDRVHTPAVQGQRAWNVRWDQSAVPLTVLMPHD